MAVKKYSLFFFIVFFVLVIDQVCKQVVSHYLFSFDFYFVRIHLVKNFGIGFGLLNFPGARWFLVAITLGVIALVLHYFQKTENKVLPVAGFGLITGGALGNLADRVLYGFVADFIDFGFWPAFNIADSAISIGVILLILYFWKYSSDSRKSRKNRKI